MSISGSIPPLRKWNHKHIILATLTGCLVLNAITAAISISLSPAHIFFSVTNATISGNKTAAGNGQQQDPMFYNLTLVAGNTSPRMAVHYGALGAEIWCTPTTWVPAVVNRSALHDDGTTQPPGSVANITVSAEFWQSEQQSSPPEEEGGGHGKDHSQPPSAAAAGGDGVNITKDSSSCTVLVTASVWFKSPWWIGTRTYDVRANCSQVNFGNYSAIVDCKG